MSAPKRDFHAKARAGTPVGTTCLRGNSQDRSSACRAGSGPGSVPTLPPLSCLSPAFMGEPPPGNTLSRPQSSQPADLSVLELPQLVAKVGPEVAMGESMWMEGPCLVASALAVDIPLKVTEPPQGVKSIPADDNIPVKRHAESEGSKTKKESKTKHSPQSGFEVFEIFARKRHLGELEFYYLKASEDGPYRPYDLQVVPPNKAGSNHYIFSPTTVMHVQNGCSVGILTLAEWYREGVLWKALRDIPFFRNYLLRKSFRWWKQNVCRIVFQRKREILHSQLLMAVPQFREALFHVTRLLEELKNVHWLPQDVKRTYTLLEFQNTLLKSNQESQAVLKRFLHYRTLILDMLQETSYKLHQDLQHQLETQLNQCSQPIHLQHASTGSLSKKLHHTEQALQRLGNVAALMDCMIVQSLVTISNHETMDFLNKVLKREHEQQGSLFQADLIFGAEGHLTLFPPMHLFQEVLLGALLSIGDSFLHVFDSCNNSPDSKDSSTACLQDLSPSTGLAYKETAPTSVDSFRSIKEPCVPSSTNLVLPKRMSLRVQGQRVRGQFYPQSRKQLEWHLHLHARTQETEKEQAKITQEAQQEVQQLFEQHSWLVDTHLFATQWNRASLDGMHGQPALKYKEHIQKVHSWRDRVCTMPPAFTTSNKLLTVTCFHIQEKLVPLLTAIEEDSLKLISEELQLHSDNLAFELKSVMERLRREPTDLADFTDYAGMVLTTQVKRYKDMSADMLQQLDHIHSLQEIIQLYCRNMTPGGNAYMEQIHHLWIQFVPLLKQAANTVKQKLPSMTDTLDSTVSSLTKEIEDLVCRASTGLYLDPNQSADQMIAELRIISRQFDATSSQLNELSRNSQSLREHPLELTFVTTAKQNIEARNGLWELKRMSTSQIQEWSLMLFSKFVVYKAQEKVSEWLQETDSIAKVIPPHDAVLQETLHNLERFNQQLSILAKLSSSTLKYKHWRNIFKGMGLPYDSEQNLTVADLMSKELLEHQHKISKICREAKASVDMEHVFRRLQLSWEGTEFRLAKFIVTVGQTVSNAPQQHSRDSGTFTIMDLEMLLAQTEDSIMTLLSMLFSPHAAEFKREAEHWVQLLQELEELLDFCERYQQKWIFLSTMFYETSVYTQKAELVEKFSPVDRAFREMIQFTLRDPHVLNFVQLWTKTETGSQFQGQNLRVLFIEGLTAMEEICSQLMHLLDSQRDEFPRLCFLSDGEVMELLQHHLPSSTLLSLVRKCFRGVRWLDVNSYAEHDLTDVYNPSTTQMWVSGVYGALREHVPFLCPLEPNLNPLIWLRLLDKKLHQTVKQLIIKCTMARHCPVPEQNDHELERDIGGIPSLDYSCLLSTLRKDLGKPSNVPELPAFLQLIAEYPLQCLLVAEELLWCSEIQMAFTSPPQTRWIQIKSQNAAKLKSLCQTIREIAAHSKDSSLASQYTVTALRTLVLLTMKHSQQIDGLVAVKGSLETSFEWQRLMKYQYGATDNCQRYISQEDPNYTEHSVYVNVLGKQLAYGYEYIGPENWMMVNTPSTDRAFLGILLALTSYRCAFISGPVMSGKKQTVLQLGWSLGQQVIAWDCSARTSSLIVRQMLLGALRTGAWLVLNSVDLLEQGTLSILGQLLTDIHECLSVLQMNTHQRVQEVEDHKGKNIPKTRDEYFTSSADMECKVLFEGKNISANLSFGCVIISSNGYSAEISENLRVASRPVSLMQPDYTTIAEILLVCLGFSEASSMSRRLVTLFNLAKDSFCLPNFVVQDQSSWLVLLKKVIHASGIHLYNSFKKTDEDRFLVLDGQIPVDFKGSAKMPQEFSLCKCTSKSFICNAVREEQAIIKGVMFALLPAIIEHKKALQFRTSFEQIFPMARSFIKEQFIEESKENLLRNAFTNELDRMGLYADTQMLHNALTLYQTLAFSKAVVLVGPAGSGKTTIYQALAGALRRLATESVQPEFEENTSCWCSVNTVVLFPNAFSPEELFGGCVKQPGSWKDGAFTKVLRDTKTQGDSLNDLSKINPKKAETRKVKWLILDGEPLSQPGWFDSLSTLVDPRESFLCLSSGETVQLSQEDLKVIVETTTLKDSTPSVLAHCSLVYVSGKDLWRAVWKAETDALYRDHTLDQSTVNMWSCLADDLFSRTLIFLRQNALTTVMSSGGDEVTKSSPGIVDGLQEVSSFIKILHAFLGEFGCGLKSPTKQTGKRDTGPEQFSSELQARNLFVVAYIWGFGGQLHPRHWPQFDILAREALFDSRYKIEVPSEGTVFEHFFSLSDGMLEDNTNAISVTRIQKPLHSHTTVPQYEKHAYILDLMLEAHQPALLVGEAGAGKTTLCKSLLSQERPHMHLPASPLLHSAYLRDILESMGNYKTRLTSLGTIKPHPGFLLFVDDLHEACFDNNGKTSMLLENLRQCISRNGILTSDGHHFKMFSSGAINYLATCSTSGTNKNSCSRISPRLSRLFTIFVLPSMTVDVLFSIHSTQLQQWLKDFPSMPKIADMARCIVTATFDLYLTACKHLRSAHAPHVVFSLHDLLKVFRGMCLWDPKNPPSSVLPLFVPASVGQAANVLNTARLWMHECLRTFGDRLSSDKDIQTLVSVLIQVSEENFGSRLVAKSQTGADGSSPACQLKEKMMADDLDQHQHSASVQQDHDQTITSRREVENSSSAEVTGHLKQSEETETEQHSSSHFSFSMSKSDECGSSDASSSTGSKNKSNPETDLLSKSAPSFALCRSPPEDTFKSSHKKMSQSLTLEYELKQSDMLTCEKSQASSKMFLQLLLEMGSSACNIVYSPELSEPCICVAQQQAKRYSVYQERDLDILVHQLAHIIKRKECNCTSGNFAVYRKRVCQLVHILRALLIPGGHGVLFGATNKTGRKTTVRLAAYLTGYQLFEVHRENEGKLKEILREAMNQIGVHGRHVIVLIHETVSQNTRDRLLVVMANGTVPGLYSDEELKDMIPNISAVMKNSRSPTRTAMVLEKYFRNKQRNLHMFLLLPLNKGSAERLSGQSPVIAPYLTKVLSLSFCAEVYQPWSSETLVEIALDHLKLLQIPETVFQAEKTLVASMAQVMSGIHQSAIKYASTFLNMQPFSLQTYFELMTYFYHLCGHLCEQVKGPADRVATVLARVKDMTDTAQEYSQQLFRLQAKFDETQKWLNQLQRAVDTERTHCERARQQCLLEKGRLSHLEDQLELVEQQARDALNEVSPLYQAALKALQSLNQSDLDEVRHYRNPPDGVVTLMNAICMLFNRPCNWESSKQLLGQPNFLQELEFFDRSHLNNELFQKLGQVVMTPNLQPHLVRDVSRACESLSCWLQALYQYACAQRHMAPQEAQKNSIIKQMAESRKRLRLARLQEEATQNKLEDMERQEQLVRKDLEDLAKQLHKVEAQKKEAADAINKLSCFTDKWIKAYKEAEIKIQTISGDALLLASVIAYLGPFGPDLRLALLEKWHKVCLTGRLDISPEDPQGSLLGKPQNTVQEPFFVPIPVAKELHQAMAQAVGLEDSLVQTVPSPLVLELLLWGLRVPWAPHWALLVDTQQQLTDKFPRNGLRSHKEKEYELVVSADDPTFLHKLRHGAEKGWRVLVTHIEHAVPIKEFLDILVRPAGSHCLDVLHPPEKLHSEFHLSISTALPVKVLMDEIHPSVLEKVKVIDLSLSTSEVQDIILTSVLQAVCPDLWVRHCQAKTDKQALQDKLHLEEASLMNYMLQSSTPLLQDPEFIPHVLRCQSTSLKLQTEIEALSSETDCFKPLLNEFHRIAVLATDLYKALQEVERLSPFYSFPLHNFLFALREALTLRGHQDSTHSGDIISCAVMSEMSQRVVSHVLAQYRPCLLQSHAEVLRLLVSVAFLKHNEGCSETERITFLKGIQNLESTEYVLSSEQSMEIPSWIPQHIQADVCLLEKIPPFHGLVSSLRNSSRQWQEYLRFPSSTVIGPVPCQSHSHLTTLQRAILWKTFFPLWLAAVADDLAASQQGQSLFSGGASGPCTSSPEALSHFLSRNEGPVIVTLLSQSKDEPRSIHPLYWIKQVAQYQADKKGVKVTVISFGSECQRGIILSALDTAVQTGHWLVLNNCHLLDHWDREVVTQLKQLMFRTTKGHLETVKGDSPVGGCAENHVHPHFRLWFITKDNVPLSVPAVVRTGAVHLVCDSYWDLRDELCSSLRQVMSTVVPATSSAYAINPVEPLVRCVILHSVMLQRQKLTYLGQGSIYNWTQEDLHTLVDAQVHIAKHCRDYTAALEYIAAYLIYGGHVSDSADLKAVEAVCRACLRPEPDMRGSGPHMLSEMITTRYFGEKDLLKSLDHCMQTSLNDNNCGVLGFSAAMTREMLKVKSHRLGILLLQSQGGYTAVSSVGVLNHLSKLPDYKTAQERLQALQENLCYSKESMSIGMSLSPLHTFLKTEWECLLEEVSSLLAIFQPPQDPSAPSYVASSTISKLETRAHLLRSYQCMEFTTGLCHVYCLSAFANPRGFLAALIKETVDTKQQDISRAFLHYQVLAAAVSPATMPSSGVCLSGLELHGALWDTRLGVLQDTLSSKPCPLPLIWVTAQERDSDSTHSNSSCSMPLYNCPLYVHSKHEDEEWSLSDVNIVTHVPLMTRLHPVLCSLRRVRLVSTLQQNRFKY